MTYLASLAISWFLVSFEPIQMVWDGLAMRIKPNHLVNYLHAGLGCWKCMSLWSTWIITGDFIQATIVSFIAFIIEECLAKLK
jgi:hypothetical protein